MGEEDDDTNCLLNESHETATAIIEAEDLLRNEQPFSELPAYSTRNDHFSQSPMIHCRVCDTIVHTEGKLHLHVIQCHACGEATPIRPPPPLKKYVRCQCNCLLICKISSRRIICPRVNCKRIVCLPPISLEESTATEDRDEDEPVTFRVVCGFCGFTFHTVCSKQTFQKCPHCSKRSYSSTAYRKNRLSIVILFLIGAVVMSSAFVALASSNVFRHKVVVEVLSGVFLFVTVSCLILLHHYCSIKTSRVEIERNVRFSANGSI